MTKGEQGERRRLAQEWLDHAAQSTDEVDPRVIAAKALISIAYSADRIATYLEDYAPEAGRMIKIRSGRRVFLGLSKANVKRLQAGEPIRITAADWSALVGPPPTLSSELEVVIFAGEDEVAMMRELEDAGAVPRGTTHATAEAIRRREGFRL